MASLNCPPAARSKAFDTTHFTKSISATFFAQCEQCGCRGMQRGFPVLSLSTPSQGMTFRCWYALKAELDSDEALLGVCCRPAIHRKKKGWFNGPPNALPAVAMAVTDRRLIAVSTGVEETDDLYGITVRCAPICKLTAVALSDFGDALMLSLKLKSGLEWKTLFERGQSASTAQYCDLLERVDLALPQLGANVSP
jgi:hypothetical protein